VRNFESHYHDDTSKRDFKVVIGHYLHSAIASLKPG